MVAIGSIVASGEVVGPSAISNNSGGSNGPPGRCRGIMGGSSIQATTLLAPPHSRQISTSMLKTRLRRCAQVMAARRSRPGRLGATTITFRSVKRSGVCDGTQLESTNLFTVLSKAIKQCMDNFLRGHVAAFEACAPG